MAKKNKYELDDDGCTITLKDLKLNLHPSVYQYFTDTKNIKIGDRASAIEKALNVGLLAAQQGRLSQAMKLFNSEMSGEYDLLSTHMDVLQHKLEKDNKFKMWSANLESGLVTSQTKWKNEPWMIKHGYEEIFDYDINDNGVIGS